MKDESQNKIKGSLPDEDWNNYPIPEIDEDVQADLEKDDDVLFPFPEVAEISSIQEYYDELEAIADERTLDLEDSLLEKMSPEKRKFYLQMECVIIPLVRCIDFIIEKRSWGKYFPRPAAAPLVYIDDSRKEYSTERYYSGLQRLTESELKTLLLELPCDEQVYNDLVLSVSSKNLVLFDNTIKSVNLSSLAELCQKYVFTFHYYTLEEIQKLYYSQSPQLNMKDQRFENASGGELYDYLLRAGNNLFSDYNGYPIRYQHILRGRSPYKIYMECYRFVGMAYDYLSYGELSFLMNLLHRPEGKEFQDRFDKSLEDGFVRDPQNDEDNVELFLPLDFLEDPVYIDPKTPVIGKFPEWFIKGGSDRLALIAEYLAEYGYIKPTIGNKRLFVSKLTGRVLATSYTTIDWILKITDKVPETEKVVLWLLGYIFEGQKVYDRAYDVLGLDTIINQRISVKQRTSNLGHADPAFRAAVENLYSLYRKH